MTGRDRNERDERDGANLIENKRSLSNLSRVSVAAAAGALSRCERPCTRRLRDCTAAAGGGHGGEASPRAS